MDQSVAVHRWTVRHSQGDFIRAIDVNRASVVASNPAALLAEVRGLILEARQTMAQGVNSALVLLYWHIGHRIRSHILENQRAGYGEQIFHSLSGKLSSEFGRGFSKTNLFNMVRFAGVFSDARSVPALCAQLSWTHLRRVIYLDDPLEREFYVEMCRIERWNTRTLSQKIQSMLFQRTALSKKPDKLMAAELKKLRCQAEANAGRRPRLLPRPPVLPPQAAPAGCD